MGGTLYGTTVFGGKYGWGTVFSITTSGEEKVLYSFGARNGDGRELYAGLIAVKGRFYGTTGYGGAYCVGSGGCGTAFSVTTKGKENVLHSFGSGTDGVGPADRLIYKAGSLIGTTQGGGTYHSGTVFQLTAP